jgi:hypothetical protein
MKEAGNCLEVSCQVAGEPYLLANALALSLQATAGLDTVEIHLGDRFYMDPPGVPSFKLQIRRLAGQNA